MLQKKKSYSKKGQYKGTALIITVSAGCGLAPLWREALPSLFEEPKEEGRDLGGRKEVVERGENSSVKQQASTYRGKTRHDSDRQALISSLGSSGAAIGATASESY